MSYPGDEADPRMRLWRGRRVQRGFFLPAIPGGPLVYLILTVVILGMLIGIATAIFGAGEKSMKVKWDAKIAADTALEHARALDVSDAIKEKEAQRIAAAGRAADADANWKEQAREARRLRQELASYVPATPATTATPAIAGGLRLAWRFVSLYDGAFTGVDGKPVFGASAQYAGAPERADTASPYGLEELVDVHGENARALSSCLRSFDDAVGKVRAAEMAWGRAK